MSGPQHQSLTASYPAVAAGPETDFIMTIETTGVDENFTITCPDIGTFDATIDWGDGGGDSTIVVFDDVGLSHTYASAATHTIRISGDFPSLRMAGASAAKVRTVENLGIVGWENLQLPFYLCTGLTSFVSGNTDISGLTVKSFYYFLRGCSSLASVDLSGTFASTMPTNQSFEAMFYGAGNGSLDLDLSVLSGVTCNKLENAFWTASLSGLDLTGIDFSPLGNAASAFRSLGDTTAWSVPGIVGIEDIDISTCSNISQYLNGTTLPTAQYNELLVNYEALNPVDGLAFHGGNSVADTTSGGFNGEVARAALFNTHSWTGTDGDGVWDGT